MKGNLMDQEDQIQQDQLDDDKELTPQELVNMFVDEKVAELKTITHDVVKNLSKDLYEIGFRSGYRAGFMKGFTYPEKEVTDSYIDYTMNELMESSIDWEFIWSQLYNAVGFDKLFSDMTK